jgi:LmbE family N-acetylglucosaminyl deacetylase
VLRNYLRKGYRSIIPLLYSKTNYKLFLKRSFTDLDERIQMVMCTTDVMPSIVQPIRIKAPFGRSMLVIAPHQDDEIIGCGGAMLLQLASGREVHVVFVMDGGGEYREDGLSREESVMIREREACKVAEEIGISKPRFLRHAEINTTNLGIIADEIKEEILRTKSDVVFVNFFLDYNDDHRMTNYALAEALGGIRDKPRIYGYEVWGLCVPNVILVVDSVMEKKQKLLSYYVSQLSGTDYLNAVTGLNMYHSRLLGAGTCKYAERFFEVPGNDYIELMGRLRSKNISKIKE